MDSQQLHVVDIPFFDDQGNQMIDDKGNIVNEDAYNAYIGNLEEQLGGTYDPEQGAIVVDSQPDLSSENAEKLSSIVPSDIDTTSTNDTGKEDGINSPTTSISFVAISKIANTNNLKYNSEEAENFMNSFKSCISDFDTDIREKINVAITHYASINAKTSEKLATMGITLANLEYDMGTQFARCIDYFNDIISTVATLKAATEEEDATTSSVTEQPTGTYVFSPSGGSSSSESTNTEDPVIPDILPDEVPDVIPGTDTEQPDIDNDFNDSIIMFGTLVLTEAVTMYETIGGVGTQASIDGNYSVLEIVKDGDNYYYKIIDNATGKVYYVPVNNQVQFATEYEKIVEIKENAMLLNSTEIGSDNFVKLADPNKIYFVQGETESNGITFYEVVEDGTGETYYIPFSDSMEVTSLDSIGSTTIQPTISTDTNVSNGLNTSGEPAVSAESGTTIIHEEGV